MKKKKNNYKKYLASLGLILMMSAAFLAPIDHARAATIEVQITETIEVWRIVPQGGRGSSNVRARYLEYHFVSLIDGVRLEDLSTCNCSIEWKLESDSSFVYRIEPSATAAKVSVQYPPDLPQPKMSATVTFDDGTTATSGQVDTTGTPVTGNRDDVSRFVDAPSLVGTLGKFVSWVVQALVSIVTHVLQWLLVNLINPLIIVLLSIAPHDAAFSAVILTGWVLVRNIMNIMFIVALIAIGLATLFRVDSYNYRHLLVKLIINALLINFSLVFARVILGVASTLQAQFLPESAEVMNSITAQLIIEPSANLFNATFTGSFGEVIGAVFLMIFAIGAFFAMVSILAFLVIRTVALWLLLLTSPLAYGLRILPATKGYSTKWWTEFLRYAFFTPILGFFLTIAAVLADAQATYVASVVNSTAAGQFVNLALTNILLIVFLYAGVKIANSTGTVGVGAVTGWASKWTKTMASYLTTKPAAYVASSARDAAVEQKNKFASKLLKGQAERYTDKGATIKDKVAAGGRMALAGALKPKTRYSQYSEALKKRREEAEKAATADMLNTRTQLKTGGVLSTGGSAELKEEKEKSLSAKYGSKDHKELAALLKEMDGNPYFENTAEGRAEKRALIRKIYEKGMLSKVMDEYKGADGKKIYGKYDLGSAMKFMSDRVGGDAEFDRFRENISDMAKTRKDALLIANDEIDLEKFLPLAEEQRRLEDTIKNEKAIQIDMNSPDAERLVAERDSRIKTSQDRIDEITRQLHGEIDPTKGQFSYKVQIGGTLQDSILAGQSERAKAHVESISGKEIGEATLKGVDKRIENPVIAEVLSKIEKNPDAPISSAVIEELMGSEIDAQTGQIIVKDGETARLFQEIYTKHPQAAVAIYNRSTGRRPGSRDELLELPKELLQNIVIQTEIKDSQGNIRDYTFRHVGSDTDDEALRSRYVVKDPNNRVRKQNTKIITNKVVGSDNLTQYTREKVQSAGGVIPHQDDRFASESVRSSEAERTRERTEKARRTWANLGHNVETPTTDTSDTKPTEPELDIKRGGEEIVS